MVETGLSFYRCCCPLGLARIIIVCSILFVPACSQNADTGTASAETVAMQNLYAQFEQQARELAVLETSKHSQSAPHTNTAAFVHPDALLEFWMYLAILQDPAGKEYALQQRFARVNVNSGLATEADSQWRYSQIVALDFQFDQLADKRSDVQRFAQRAALELSGTDAEQQRIWIGGFDSRNVSSAPCHYAIQLSSPQLQLRFGDDRIYQSSCELHGGTAIEQVAGFSVMRSTAMPVAGRYQSVDNSIELSGHGWLVHGWGVPPNSSGAAVVFDRAWLLPNHQHDVQLQRSRRTSGRGPQITTATVLNVDPLVHSGQSPQELGAQLIDNDSRQTGNLRTGWQLKSSDQTMDVTLKPVELSDRAPVLSDQSWFGVVAIEGSHNGYGFVESSLF